MDRDAKTRYIEYSAKPSFKSRIVKEIIKAGMTIFNSRDLGKTRRLWDSSSQRMKMPKGYIVKGISISDVECEWVMPEAPKGKKTIVYLHGGGYVLGSLNTARGLALQYAKHTGEKVLSVGYRLAPENPFPAALDDSLAVYYKLLQEGIEPKNVIITGDSAGGGLSLATVLALKDKGDPLPGAVICLSPWTDLAGTGESNRQNAKLDPIFGHGSGVIKPQDYAGSEDLFNPLISPLYGDYADFSKLLIHVGTDEVIFDDSMRLAKKAKEAGVDVKIKVWKGMWHVFQSFHNSIPEAKQAFREIGEFINKLNE